MNVKECDAAGYRRFLEAKVAHAASFGFDVADSAIHPILKPHQRAIVRWLVAGGRRACFAAFGLGKTVIQLEAVRLVRERAGGNALIVIPLGVRQEFFRDAAMLGTPVRFIRRIEEVDDGVAIYLTNYETVRDGKLDARRFGVVSLDEAGVLRGFGGTKTFREMMRLFEGSSTFRFVATATPSPNEYIELLAYAAFLDIMDVSGAKTRFFRRNSEKADQLTLHPHKEREFWLWIASWALFVQKPSDLGFDDTGYDMPALDVRWHRVATDHAGAGFENNGQGKLLKDAAIGVQDAAREKRSSLSSRIAKLLELRAEDPDAHRIIWHDLEAERDALEKAVPGGVSIYGTQDLDEREQAIIDFSDGRIAELLAKPVIAGSGCNFQRHCAWEVFLGIGFKFNDFIQSIHRVQRFLQTRPVRIDLIYTEAEHAIRRTLERKWAQHNTMVAKMTEIIREYGLAHASFAHAQLRSIGCERVEVTGEGYRLVNADAIEESKRMPSDSADLIVTSIPFSTQYEYTPSYNDLGHTDNDAHFFEHLGFLTPELLRILKPGRVAAIHVKDRIVPGGLTGLGFQTVSPFSDHTIAHFTAQGFAFLGRKTIVTDVVRENNQTYRLGWTEQCKDGSRMGAGMPEYVLLFRKPPTDRSNGYADQPVVKSKERYSRSRWQIDAHGFQRSNGNRHLTPEELCDLPHKQIFKLFRSHSLSGVYDYEHHVKIGEALEEKRRLPVTFMLLQPQSWHPDVWTDVARMRTLNMMQERKGQQMHLCLARGSLVLTRGAGLLPIEEVIAGDEVLTHRGRWRRVLVTENTGLRPVIEVKAHGVPGLRLTPDHKLWTRPVRDLAWARNHSRREAMAAEPEWVSASNTVGSYVNLQLPPVEPASVENECYWRAVGRWLADGHISGRGDSFVISCGHHETEALIAQLGEYGGNHPNDTGTAIQITLRDPDRSLRRILEKCGRGAAEKRLPPEAFTLPLTQAHSLLEGYLSGDGHYVSERQRYTASSISRRLVLGMAMLAQRVYGAVASVYTGRAPGTATIQGRTVTTRQEWILCFDLPNDDRPKGRPFVLEDGAWKKVRSAEPAGEVETWNLRVEEDESYTAEGCVVKNCPIQFDIVDRLIVQFSQEGETIFDPFCGLATVPYCALKLRRRGVGIELNPQYFADGAGYCEAVSREMSTPTLFDLDAAPPSANGSSAANDATVEGEWAP